MIIGVCGAYIDKHERFRVATDRVLHEMCKFIVSIWYMVGLLTSRQSLNNSTKSCQALVNLGPFSHPLDSQRLFIVALRTSKVHERDLALCSLACFRIDCLDYDSENQMRA